MKELFVCGKPRTSGSKTGYIKNGKMILAPAGKYQKPWQEAVKWAAIQKGYHRMILLEGHLKLSVQFIFLRPKGHFKRDGELTKSARTHHTTKPDLDKLTRAVADALTGIIWRDDSQIVEIEANKTYGSPEGAYIKIEEIGE